MAIPSRGIGWGTEENLLWQISKQLEYLSGITYNSGGGSGSGTSGSSGTSGGSGTSGSAGTAGLSGSSGSSGLTGTSGLSGDRYKTESTTEFALGSAGALVVGTGLSYTVAQDIIIAYDSTHHQVSMVTSYDSGTGILVFGAPSETTGTGTFSDWTVNLNGAAGGNGTAGTSGSAGTSGLSGTSGVAGTSGSAGTSGASGTNGSSGTSASSGTAGVAGTAGTSGTSPSFPYPLVYGLFSQTSNSATVTNTTTESSLVGTGVGTLSVPSNGFSIGDSFLGRIVGHISSKNNDTIRIKIKSGSVILGDTGLVTVPQTTNKHYTVDLNFTVRTIGAAGVASIATGMVFTYSKDASNAFEGYNSTIINTTTFDTTSSNTLDVTIQWGSADALNSIYSEYFTLNKVY